MAEYLFSYDNEDDIPESIEDFRGLFTNKAGKFELTGIAGLKTDADVSRLRTSLEKERADHRETKEKLQTWGDLDHEDVMAKLDRFPELEAAAGGNLDDAKIEELANKRVDGIVSSRLRPLERDVTKLTRERDELAEKVAAYEASERNRAIGDALRGAMKKHKTNPDAEGDILRYGDLFEVHEDGAVLTRESGNGTPAGMTAEAWIESMSDSRSHWWPPSQGGGARGDGRGGSGARGENPWTHEHWNKTKQGRIFEEKGEEYATRLAKAAGTTLDGLRPPAKA